MLSIYPASYTTTSQLSSWTNLCLKSIKSPYFVPFESHFCLHNAPCAHQFKTNHIYHGQRT